MVGKRGVLNVRLILAPYDSGHRGVRMGAGPEHLVENGLKEALEGTGRTVGVRVVESESALPAEVAVAFELDSLISREVSECRASGEFPVVLSGNCNCAVGTMAGLGCENLGVVWLDGHPDFNVPDTTTTGFSDNMGLSIAVGDCWSGMASNIPGFSPVEERNVFVVGARDMEPAEQSRLEQSEVSIFGADTLKDGSGVAAFDFALKELSDRTGKVYLHLDLDVLDPDLVGPANEFAPASGLTVEEASEVVRLVRDNCDVAAVGVASYDPATDRDSGVLDAARRLVASLF